MLFNSIEFLLFFPVVCLIYFLLRSNRWRIPFLLVASYYFYMNWKPIYALLILFSTVITYMCGLLVERHSGDKFRKRAYLLTSLVINFAVLFVFKYFNFINESVFGLLEMAGMRLKVPNLDVLLPVGISFYTFQAVGYTVDVYRGTIKAEREFITYALFVSFFPQLVAGPIERAQNLLPQFHEEHCFKYEDAIEGLKQMLWGFFMKLCVADVLSSYVNAVFNNVAQHNGTSMILATIFFAFQIYCDFGGYSNIAIGAARVMGFRLMGNFRCPYFSLNIKEFWKRWHISLSSWFKDYVYIPLGGSRVKYPRHLLNLMITFLVSGLWHGANWTYVMWGGVHGVYQVVGNICRKYFHAPVCENFLSRGLSMVFCFVLVAFAWIFFRANNVSDAFTIVGKIFTEQGAPFIERLLLVKGCAALLVLILKDAKDNYNWRLNFMHSRYAVVRYVSTVALVMYILLLGSFEGGQFIYFQF
ncbi:MAG: MBOAT family protein [Bacteroidales bacterium]|nr:MBOAT family protein [Bacteroidales bacterium]